MLLSQLVLSIYVLASALTGFDKSTLPWYQVIARLTACVLMFSADTQLEWLGIAIAIMTLIHTHFLVTKTETEK